MLLFYRWLVTFQDLTVVGQLAYGVHIDGTYGKGNDACDSSWTPPNLSDVSSISFINIDGTDAIIGNDDGDANAFHLVGIEGGPVTGIFISETQFTMSVDQGSPWLCSDVLGDAESDTVLPWPPCDEIQQVSSLDGYILKDFTSEHKKFKQICPKEMIDKLSNPLSLKQKKLKVI